MKVSMEKKFLVLLCAVVLTSMTVTVWAANEESDPLEPIKECRWEQQSCGFLQGSREICVETGDAFICNCGSVTRKC